MPDDPTTIPLTVLGSGRRPDASEPAEARGANGGAAGAASSPVDPGDRALDALAGFVAEATRSMRPLCVASGCCCAFEAFGHRLYVTALEVRRFLDRLEDELGRGCDEAMVEASIQRGDCPFLVAGACSVHPIRPLACRMFFCDPAVASSQQELYEEVHARIRAIHAEHGSDYRYGEWRALLRVEVHRRLRRRSTD
ncbi:MAG TPA: hypothetical protein PKC43_11595 [Phycisphaerales bacterium]|nr:hypothetical protein [Phycisphaerales bacterium]HMP38076.1 hypothetical protein [Phycisphaerales bacterium]